MDSDLFDFLTWLKTCWIFFSSLEQPDPEVAPNIKHNHNVLHWAGRPLTRTRWWQVLNEKEFRVEDHHSTLTNVNFQCSLDPFFKCQTPIQSVSQSVNWSFVSPSETDPEQPCSYCSQPQECPSSVPWVATVFFQSVHMTSKLTSRVNYKVRCSLKSTIIQQNLQL